MAKVHPGRYTATIDGEFVVFVIGMRFNKLWKVHQWLPVFRAMPKMIATLMKHPEKGMLGARTMWAGRTITMIQYWRSFDHLERFSRDANDPHLGPWRRYNQRVAKSGDVGVYHETYKIGPGTRPAREASDYFIRQGTDPDVGVAQKQPKQLSAGVAARSGDCHRNHVHILACTSKCIQSVRAAGRHSPNAAA